jgi:hypothetical protein
MGIDPNAKMDVRMNRQERLEIFKDALRSPDLEAFGFKSFSAKKIAYSSISKLGAQKREGSSSRYFAKDSDTVLFVCLNTHWRYAYG